MRAVIDVDGATPGCPTVATGSAGHGVELSDAVDAAARRCGRELESLLASGWALPLPGHGRTALRWRGLAALGRTDLALARLAEGHADAVAVLTELGVAPPPHARLGVWAARPPGGPVSARRDGDRWLLTGVQPWCSGARVLTAALVTAAADDGQRLFLVDLAAPEVTVRAGSWVTAGMAGSDTVPVSFAAAAAQAVGGVGSYLARPGFWHGGIGVAAVWAGGTRAVADALLDVVAAREPDVLRDAALGAVDVALAGVESALAVAAGEVDAAPHDIATAQLRAGRVRALAARCGEEVLATVGRTLGAGPLAHDARFATRMADLTIYLRQHHGERDLAAIGALLRERR